MPTRTTVELPLVNLKRFQRELSSRSSKMRRIRDTWTRMYAAEMRRRYKIYSRGGGNWRRLAPSTLAARRNRNKRSAAILIDTGLMFSAFSPSFVSFRAGDSGPMSVVISFGGKKRYRSGDAVTTIMSYHNRGGGSLPKRQLLIQPPPHLRKQMAEAAKKILLS